MDLPSRSRKRCSHCAIEKTPQWRKGPVGAKPLCNACGVRYRLGQLVPEYRPAGSPTFDASRHSNSQVKVMELRRRREIILGQEAKVGVQIKKVDLLDMTKESRDLVASQESPVLGPDYFSFCKHEVALLLSQDDSIVPFKSQTSELSRKDSVIEDKHATKHHLNCKKIKNFPGHTRLFSNSIGSGISDIRRERLKGMLRENVTILSQEVDESTHSIAVLHYLQSHVQYKEQSSASGDGGKNPQETRRRSLSTDVPAHANHIDMETSETNVVPLLCPCIGAERENGLNSCLRLVLENDNPEIWKTMQKGHFDRLYATVKHMEVQLEELLDTIMSRCRQMSLEEKNELRKMIEKLPPRNIDYVVEIIQHCNHKNAHKSDEINVDLQKLDNVTLWRLYYYTEAVKRAANVPPL